MVEEELHAIRHGVFRSAERDAVRIADAAFGNAQSRDGVLRDVRLERKELFTADNRDALHAVHPGPLLELMQDREFLFRIGYDQRAVLVVGEAELALPLRVKRRTGHVVMRFGAAWLRVVAGVHNAGIGARRPAGDVEPRFEHDDAEVEARELPCGAAPHNAGTYHRDVI